MDICEGRSGTARMKSWSPRATNRVEPRVNSRPYAILGIG